MLTTVICREIDTSKNEGYPEWRSRPFKLETEWSVPDDFFIELYDGVTYVLTKWDSNHIIRFTKIKPDCNHFETIEQYGKDLEVGKEYILIRPKY